MANLDPTRTSKLDRLSYFDFVVLAFTLDDLLLSGTHPLELTESVTVMTRGVQFV